MDMCSVVARYARLCSVWRIDDDQPSRALSGQAKNTLQSAAKHCITVVCVCGFLEKNKTPHTFIGRFQTNAVSDNLNIFSDLFVGNPEISNCKGIKFVHLSLQSRSD